MATRVVDARAAARRGGPSVLVSGQHPSWEGATTGVRATDAAGRAIGPWYTASGLVAIRAEHEGGAGASLSSRAGSSRDRRSPARPACARRRRRSRPARPRRAAPRRRPSYTASPCSGGAAPVKLGRFPRRVSAYRVNCETASTPPPTSPSARFIRPASSPNTRSRAVLAASLRAAATSSSWVTPTRARKPRSTAPTSAPFTATAARLTRWSSTLIGRRLRSCRHPTDGVAQPPDGAALSARTDRRSATRQEARNTLQTGTRRRQRSPAAARSPLV